MKMEINLLGSGTRGNSMEEAKSLNSINHQNGAYGKMAKELNGFLKESFLQNEIILNI